MYENDGKRVIHANHARNENHAEPRAADSSPRAAIQGVQEEFLLLWAQNTLQQALSLRLQLA
jgi:hypothetical protein